LAVWVVCGGRGRGRGRGREREREDEVRGRGDGGREEGGEGTTCMRVDVHLHVLQSYCSTLGPALTLTNVIA
jgi:hypothetical protein